MDDVAAFENAITEFDDAGARLRDVWDDLMRAVNRALNDIPAVIAGKLRDVVSELAARFAEALENMVKYATERGSASAVIAAAGAWNTEVAHRVAAQIRELDPIALDTTDEWDSPAATRYGEAVTGQGRALNQLKALVDSLQSTLLEIASALRSHWIAMAVAAAGYVAAMIVAFEVCAGVVTVPAGVAAAGAATIVFLAQMIDHHSAYTNTLNEKKGVLDRLFTTSEGISGVDWPTAGTEKMDDWKPVGAAKA